MYAYSEMLICRIIPLPSPYPLIPSLLLPLLLPPPPSWSPFPAAGPISHNERAKVVVDEAQKFVSLRAKYGNMEARVFEAVTNRAGSPDFVTICVYGDVPMLGTRRRKNERERERKRKNEKEGREGDRRERRERR